MSAARLQTNIVIPHLRGAAGAHNGPSQHKRQCSCRPHSCPCKAWGAALQGASWSFSGNPLFNSPSAAADACIIGYKTPSRTRVHPRGYAIGKTVLTQMIGQTPSGQEDILTRWKSSFCWSMFHRMQRQAVVVNPLQENTRQPKKVLAWPGLQRRHSRGNTTHVNWAESCHAAFQSPRFICMWAGQKVPTMLKCKPQNINKLPKDQ